MSGGARNAAPGDSGHSRPHGPEETAMRTLSKITVAAVLFAAAGLGVAQIRVQPIARPAAVANPAVGRAVIDLPAQNAQRLRQLQRKTQELEGRVATLEAALREARAVSEFTCSAPTTSTNGRGSENCSPYACNYLDGRCRTRASTSADCAPGFGWEADRCVPPPASSDD